MSPRELTVLAGLVLAVTAVVGSTTVTSIRRRGDVEASATTARCLSVVTPRGVVRAPGDTADEAFAWRDVATQPALQFALVWNAQFRSHEIVWRNRSERTLHFRFSADSVGATAARVRERVLEAGITESMPGEAVAPGRATGVVCIRVVTLPTALR